MLKSNLKQSIAFCLSLALFLSSLFTALHFHVTPAEAAVTLPDNVYQVSYLYVKDGTSSDSAANLYLSVHNSGKLIVQNGKITFEHEITPQYYGYFQYLAFRNPGAAKAVINTSTNTAQGTEGYTLFPVRPANNGTGNLITTIHIEDITKKQDVLMHVVIKDAPEFGNGFHYDYWYNVQLDINTKDLPLEGNNGGNTGGETEQPITLASLQELVSVSKSVYQSTYEGTSLGDAPAGTMLPFYTKIVQAENFIATGNTSPEAIKAAFNELTAALNTFQSSRYSSDKRVLASLIAVVTEFRDGIKEIGYTDDQLGSSLAPASPGEFIVGPKVSLSTQIERAQTVYNEPKSTQAEVDNAVRILTGEYNSVKDSYYIISDDSVRVIALDSLNPTNVPSVNAPEISGTASFTTLKGADLGTRANITFNTSSAITDVMQPNVSSNGGYTAVEYRTPQFIKSSNGQTKVFQATIRRSNVNEDTKWLGQSYLRYKLDGVTKVVYLSFNADQLDALNASAEAAQTLSESATALPGAESAYSTAKTALQSKIDAAKGTAQNLASTRPQINTASTALQQAVDTFKVSAAYPLYFTTTHATSDTFSAVESYFLKPATVTTEGGAVYVSFTIKDSAVIKEFQVKTGGQYVDAAVVSENTTDNTRVVKFKADSLSALLDAKVHISIPAQNYDRTHDIRLNLNNVDNSALAQAVADANTLYRTSVAGTEPGQYPQASKAALQSAINTAGAEATRLTGTTERTAAALQTLQQAVNAFKASVIVEPTNPGTIKDGEYPIGFTIYKKGTDEKSVMYDYVDPQSGKLTVIGGKKYVTFTVKQNAEIKSFKTERNGVLTETETVSTDAAANTRIVKFEVTDLEARLNGWVKIYWVLPAPIGIYDHEYEVELGFDFQLPTAADKSQLTAAIDNAKAKLAAAVEGSSAGQYAIGSKAVLQTAITASAAVIDSSSATQQAVDEALKALKKSVAIFLASVTLADANYSFNWPSTIKDGAGTPMTNFILSGASMKVSGGKQVVTLQLVSGVTFKKLQMKKADGALEDVSTVAAAKQAGIVKVLDTSSAAASVNFEIKDRSAVYVLSLSDAAQTEHAFEIDFSEISLSPVTDPGTDNGSGKGSSGRGGGGGAAVIIKPLAETLEAGKYTIDYALYSRGTAQTSVADPFVKHPAKLEIADGKSYILWTVSGKEVTGLKVTDTSGAWTDAQVVAANDKLNEQTVRFEIQNAQTKVLTQFKLSVPDKYNGEYEADIVFNEASIQQDKSSTDIPSQPDGNAAITDVQNHWAQASIEQAVALGIVNGYEDGTFRPDSNINRAEFITLLNKALKLGQSSNELSFTDSATIPQWVKPYLSPVVEAGIITGYEDGAFRADRQISRAELAVIIVRGMKLKVDADARASFSDADSIPQWAQAEVAAAHNQGIISGRDNNRFEPTQNATRAEAVYLILSLYKAAHQ
ncbi:NEAT domain-containing protein [Paenibacillus sp. UNC451MF]|uniref:NEAT domain-containing protein n=1 Tax=Paenibacillus sp. UNC451MF TaxID=1449063 RepID=UPI00048C9B5B|nr:NEAT domain-containing protein [Paenibacillus sp. UNC451MF]